MCTPRLLWIPEHCMHTKIPKFTLAHLGPLQSNQIIQNQNRLQLFRISSRKIAFKSIFILMLHWSIYNYVDHLFWILPTTYLALQSAHSLFSGNLRRPSSICISWKIGKYKQGNHQIIKDGHSRTLNLKATKNKVFFLWLKLWGNWYKMQPYKEILMTRSTNTALGDYIGSQSQCSKLP